jgi:hypothetical protein
MFALLLVFVGWWGIADHGWAVQQHELGAQSGEAGHGTISGGEEPAVGHGSEADHGSGPVHAVQYASAQVPSGAADSQSSIPQPPQAHPAPSDAALGQPPGDRSSVLSTPAAPDQPGLVAPLPGHGGEAIPHAEHGPVLPEISPTPGVTFVETMIKLLDHELDERTLGWRPNDIIVGRFTDNINNYQLGVLEALRFTTLRLKDSLTRMGDADAYDPDLEQALNLLMNRSTLFLFPSAERAYGEAADHFRNFSKKLQTGQRSFYYRVDSLRLLISSYKDLLGNVNRTLIRSPVSWFEADDYFYYAKGVAHVYYEILRVVRVGYKSQLASTLNALDIMDEILHELHRAEQIDPWLVLDSDLDSFFANHRANLNAPLSEVAHLLGVMSSF